MDCAINTFDINMDQSGTTSVKPLSWTSHSALLHMVSAPMVDKGSALCLWFQLKEDICDQGASLPQGGRAGVIAEGRK